MQDSSAPRRYRSLYFALMLAVPVSAMTVAPLPWAVRQAFSQDVVVVDVDVKEVTKGYRASEISGSDVENSAGDTVGSIDDLIVDREKVMFAILEIGGFLGIGGFLVAVPYDSLEITEDGAKIVVAEGSKEELQDLPEFKYESN